MEAFCADPDGQGAEGDGQQGEQAEEGQVPAAVAQVGLDARRVQAYHLDLAVKRGEGQLTAGIWSVPRFVNTTICGMLFFFYYNIFF